MNPASALHGLLARLHESDLGLPVVWAAILEAEFASPQFVKRHSEVLTLFANTLRLIATLPDAPRERYLRYAPKWWVALVMPQHTWSNAAGSSTISSSDLDHLEALGDLLQLRLPATAVNPDESRLQKVQESLQSVLEELDHFTSMPEQTRLLIQADIMHVLWLISNITLFGTGRVAEEAERVTGAVTVASHTLTDSQQRASWVEKAKTLFAAVSVFVVGATGSMSIAITGVNEVLEQIQTTQEHLAEILDGDTSPSVNPGRPEQTFPDS